MIINQLSPRTLDLLLEERRREAHLHRLRRQARALHRMT